MNVIACCCDAALYPCEMFGGGSTGNWIVHSGTWQDLGSFIRMSSGTGGSAEFDHASVGMVRHRDVRTIIKFQHFSGGGVIRVKMDWDGGNNYVCVEYNTANSRIRFISVAGGVDTVLLEEYGFVPNAVMYDPATGRMVAYGQLGSVTYRYYVCAWNVPAFTYDGMGFEIVSRTSTVVISSIKFCQGYGGSTEFGSGNTDYPDCLGIRCADCTGGGSVDSPLLNELVDLTFSGVQNNLASNCSDLSGTYTLRYLGAPKFVSPVVPVLDDAVCFWRYEFPSTVCGYRFMYLGKPYTPLSSDWYGAWLANNFISIASDVLGLAGTSGGGTGPTSDCYNGADNPFTIANPGTSFASPDFTRQCKNASQGGGAYYTPVDVDFP
jgi:hypothetical protein